jgi:tripartite-type tricarboxylate transporter receptor subunit TctC
LCRACRTGAGSKAGAYFYNKAPHDGSIISLFPETIAYVQLMDPVQGKWDVTRMSYIGSFAPVNTAFMLRKDAPAKTAQDLFKVRTNVGCSGRTSQSYQYPATMKAPAGMNLNIICGSKAWNAWRAEDKESIENGTLIPIMQGGLKRTPELSNVPLMQELTDNPTAKKALEFISAGSAVGRALLAPQDVPADRLAALRTAFDKLVVDPEFLADVQKRNLYIEPTPGTEVQTYSDAIIKTPKEIVDITSKAFDAM